MQVRILQPHTPSDSETSQDRFGGRQTCSQSCVPTCHVQVDVLVPGLPRHPQRLGPVRGTTEAPSRQVVRFWPPQVTCRQENKPRGPELMQHARTTDCAEPLWVAAACSPRRAPRWCQRRPRGDVTPRSWNEQRSERNPAAKTTSTSMSPEKSFCGPSRPQTEGTERSKHHLLQKKQVARVTSQKTLILHVRDTDY